MKKVILTLAILGIAFTSSCVFNSFNGRNFNHYAKRQINASSPLQPGAQVCANLTHMDITVTGQDTSECVVLAELSISAVSQEIADAVRDQIDVELIRETDRLMIVLNKPQEYKDDYCVSGQLTITAPSDTELQITTTHGDCSFDNISSNINIQSTHGDFVFKNICGDITSASTHGNIELSNTQNASVNIKTSHGRIELNDCTIKRVICSTTHDPIRLTTVSADSLDLRSTHDPIELTACTAKEAVLNTSHGTIRGDIAVIERVTARTSHAPIRLQCTNDVNPNIVAALNTTHNNIEFWPPAGFAGSISASTSHGHIYSDLPMTVQGTIGDDNLTGTIGQGTGSITLTTTHGKISIKSPK